MNREEIKELIPHREPMLLLDSLEIGNGVARGQYLVRGDEWFLQGHFPGNPVVPGVILCEIMAQTCSVLLGENIKGNTRLIMRVSAKHASETACTRAILLKFPRIWSAVWAAFTSTAARHMCGGFSAVRVSFPFHL
jgi:3-hydroxymyristoyl/3-hydroxydecanoyl-(acyl carrier protein) dehydratase